VFADELRYEFALVYWSRRFHFFAFSFSLYKPTLTVVRIGGDESA
jgi:hypothetical protein